MWNTSKSLPDQYSLPCWVPKIFHCIKMCHRTNPSSDGVYERFWRGAVQDIVENATMSATTSNSQRARSRNRKKFRRWKKRSLMKKQQKLLTPQKKAMNHVHCGDHCLGWMGLNKALVEADSKGSLVGFCCCSTQLHYLQLLLNKSGHSTQSLKSIVRWAEEVFDISEL